MLMPPAVCFGQQLRPFCGPSGFAALDPHSRQLWDSHWNLVWYCCLLPRKGCFVAKIALEAHAVSFLGWMRTVTRALSNFTFTKLYSDVTGLNAANHSTLWGFQKTHSTFPALGHFASSRLLKVDQQKRLSILRSDSTLSRWLVFVCLDACQQSLFDVD